MIPFRSYIQIAYVALICSVFVYVCGIVHFKWEDYLFADGCSLYDKVYFICDSLLHIFILTACVFLSLWVDVRFRGSVLVARVKYISLFLAGVCTMRFIFNLFFYNLYSKVELILDGLILALAIYKYLKTTRYVANG